MKLKKLFTTLALASVALFAGCKEDEFVEILGICPVVISTSPENGATDVPLEKIVTATFNGKMNPETITNAAFTLQGAEKVAGTLTYNTENNTLSFAPASPLAPATTYTGRVAASVKDERGNALQTDYVWTFSTGATVSPVVIATDPENNATGVVLNKIIAASFSVPMDPLTLTAATFTLKQGTTAVAGTIAYSGTTAYFTPADALTANTVYTATIAKAAKNEEGTPLVNDYTWTFTTGAVVAPKVISTDPDNNATDVVLNKIIAASFSVPMDPLTLTAATFTLKQGTTAVAGTIAYSGTTAYFTPADALTANTVYTATIAKAAKNEEGTPLVNDYTWTFTTGAVVAPKVISTDPDNNATDVALDKVISATFSEAMDPLTATTASFTLKAGTTAVTGAVSYSGTTASFNPTDDFLANTTYTATITTAAKNVAGISLASDYVWTFTTTAPVTPAPQVGVDLKSVARFGIFAGVGISNNAGFSEIRNLDVGITPGVRSSVTGFPPAIVVNGDIYASDDTAPAGVPAMLIQAKQDLVDAYLFAEGASFPAPATVAGDQGGKTLAPGIYKSTSTLLVQAGDLTLDAQGDPNAVWIFQIASDFTTVGGAGGNIILTGGAQAKNIFWQTGSSATIGDGTSFKGNILALTSITMNSGATAVGRMLARNGAVVLTNTNIIEKP